MKSNVFLTIAIVTLLFTLHAPETADAKRILIKTRRRGDGNRRRAAASDSAVESMSPEATLRSAVEGLGPPKPTLSVPTTMSAADAALGLLNSAMMAKKARSMTGDVNNLGTFTTTVDSFAQPTTTTSSEYSQSV